MNLSRDEQKVLKTIKQFAKKLPKFPDGRIDYSKSDIAPVITIFIKYQDKILLLKRSSKVSNYPGKWNAVSGYLDEVKPLKDKILEELKEELSIQEDIILNIKYGKSWKLFDKKINKTWLIYPIIVELNKKPLIKLDWEHTDYKWIRPEEITKFDIVTKLDKSLENALIKKPNYFSKIRQELKANIDAGYKKGAVAFFKEKVKIYGVRMPIVRKITGKYFLLIKNLDKKKIFTLAENLLKSGYSEEATIAFDWAMRLKKQYQKSDFKILESWLKKYASNWAKCDDFCSHAFAEFILRFPEFLPQLNIWARSQNRWLRRASAVILINPVKKDKRFLNKVFEICNILLEDKDDLVQKGYGWLLKEASNFYQKQVFDYVIRNKSKMPRTALRYAIEKMPEEMREKAKKRS